MTTKLRLHTPVDVIEAVPTLLGFHPTDSIVMVVVSAPRPFHARLDLPDTASIDGAVAALLAPARQHHVERVLFVTYSDDDQTHLHHALAEAFTAAGIDVVDTIRTDGQHIWSHSGVDPVRTEPSVITASTVAMGISPVADRATLAQYVAADPARFVTAEPDADLDRPAAERLIALIRTGADTGSYDDLPAVLAHLHDTAIVPMLAACTALESDLSRHAFWWAGALAVTPDTHRAAVAHIAAYVAYLSGHGALAWCCLDTSPEANRHLVDALRTAKAPPRGLIPLSDVLDIVEAHA